MLAPERVDDASFARISISVDDLYEASEYLRALSPELGFVPRKALLTAAVIAYVRPFIKNHGTPNYQKVSLDDLGGPFSDDEVRFHQQLITWRSQAVAHSDFELKPMQRIFGSANGCVMQKSDFCIEAALRGQVDRFRQLTGRMLQQLQWLNGYQNRILAEQGNSGTGEVRFPTVTRRSSNN